MITDMAWADIDKDGDSDMVIVGDWMPVKIFVNENGSFRDESEKYGLANTEGWWHTITAKDLNGDGFVDFVLGNQGLNTFFKTSPEKPLSMFVNDFDLNGSIEQIICAYNGDKSYPVPMKDDLVKQLPSLATKYTKYADYKDQTIEQIFPAEILNRSVVLYTKQMKSCFLMNSGKGSFSISPLPVEAQLSPIYSINAEDFNHDGICDLVLGGNQYRAKPETGIYDASYVLFFKGNADGSWKSVPYKESGLFTKGEVRDLKILNIDGVRTVVVARNNKSLQFFKY